MTSSNSALKSDEISRLATMINKSLNPKGITVNLVKEPDYLKVILQAKEVPSPSLADTIYRGFVKLKVHQRENFLVCGYRQGSKSPGWSQEFKKPAIATEFSKSSTSDFTTHSSPSNTDNSKKRDVHAASDTPSSLSSVSASTSANVSAAKGADVGIIGDDNRLATPPPKARAQPRSTTRSLRVNTTPAHQFESGTFGHVQSYWFFTFLMIVTLGVYSIVWHYKQWRLIAQAQGKDFNGFLAFLAAIFQGFCIYKLAAQTFKITRTPGIKSPPIFAPFLITALFWILYIGDQLQRRIVSDIQINEIASSATPQSYVQLAFPFLISFYVPILIFAILIYLPILQATRKYQKFAKISYVKNQHSFLGTKLVWMFVILIALVSNFLIHGVVLPRNYATHSTVSQCIFLRNQIRQVYTGTKEDTPSVFGATTSELEQLSANLEDARGSVIRDGEFLRLNQQLQTLMTAMIAKQGSVSLMEWIEEWPNWRSQLAAIDQELTQVCEQNLRQ